MKKYNKPELEILRFDIESSVMAPTTSPTPMPGVLKRDAVISDATDYIPTESVDQKVWTTIDEEENWNWQ